MTFEEALDVADIVARRRRLRRQVAVMRAIIATLLVAAVVVTGYPLALQWYSSRELAAASAQASQQVAGWPYPQAEETLAAARDYNARLAERGQSVLGEAGDPFSSLAGGSQASDEDDSVAARDEDYQSQLDAGDGVMGTIRVPKVSIELPIYHGTSESVLARGAGHLYGTSLPVGGESTHSVITGHRGLVEALMFTRIDELVEGDFIYVEVMGETLGYEVDRITVIEPDDDSQLTIVPGEDRLTLMTCTPYGVNTHRLLVSGHRVSIPNPAPDPTDLYDARTIALWVGMAVLAVGWGALRIVGYIRRSKRNTLGACRHLAD
ncbi:sortase [Bifidobacterium lemurum]|uniref:Sortase n=1 Tax=Bifidobacterium lemurum TaxID=1603886 RepID=A0A261FUX3_9BIFI|nr:class C sortase [Bifidobacterium lemurum]OZG62972.1 sortase [Bifidobacterium lemurum]QOL33323.1 class C sortase [Bifidobacterium lemurum]